MEAANVVPLHSQVRLEGDRIVIDRLTLADPALAAFLGERPAAERGPLVERALRIGLLALRAGDARSAVAYLQEALAGGLNGSDTLAALARARWSSGDAAGAEATIDRALAADPDNIELQRLARAIKRTSGRVDPEARHPRS